MKNLQDFYNESPTKSKTRYSILESAAKIFSHKGIETATMLEIADSAGVAIRNLYRYYPNIELLAVDVTYFMFNTYLANVDFHILDGKNTGYEAVRESIDILLGLYDEKHSNTNFFKFIMYFDIFISNLDKEHPAFLLYTNKYVKELYHGHYALLSQALEKGIKDGTVNLDIEEVTPFTEFIIQSIGSVLMRVEMKEYENPSINRYLIDKQVELIFSYIKK